MTLMKKGIAVLLSAVLAANMSVCMEAVGSFSFHDDIVGVEIPQGYELFEDGLMYFNPDLSCFKHGLVYREVSDEEDPTPYRSIAFHDYVSYNVTELWLKLDSDWESLYEPYKDAIAFDYVDSDILTLNGEDVLFLFCCDKPEEGEDIRNPVSVESKFEVIQKMCADMNEQGSLLKADYTGTITIYHCKMLYNTVSIKNYAGTEDELMQIASQFTNDVSVKYVEQYGLYNVSLSGLAHYGEMYRFCDAVRTAYPECKTCIQLSGDEAGGKTVSTETIDILSALEQIPESANGDINADGTTDITDAVLILQHYAESAASGASAAAETNMDVNGDGSVDLDDATAVLQIYAENAAGVDAS